jgi:hypothetical protein
MPTVMAPGHVAKHFIGKRLYLVLVHGASRGLALFCPGFSVEHGLSENQFPPRIMLKTRRRDHKDRHKTRPD